MGTHPHILKVLRQIVLEHGAIEQPDLASMARELGRVVYQDASALATRLEPLRARGHGLERWLLAERSQPPLSVLLLAWPPNHLTPVHGHAGRWGLEMTLHGALEVQSFARDPLTGDLRMRNRDWLGPGDGSWFERNESQPRRCRNLSKHDTALTLHVYGGDLAQYFACEQAEPGGRRIAQPRLRAITGRLRH